MYSPETAKTAGYTHRITFEARTSFGWARSGFHTVSDAVSVHLIGLQARAANGEVRNISVEKA